MEEAEEVVDAALGVVDETEDWMPAGVLVVLEAELSPGNASVEEPFAVFNSAAF